MKNKKNYTDVLISKLNNLKNMLLFFKKVAVVILNISIISSITLVITNILIKELFIMYIAFALIILGLLMHFIKLKILKTLPDLNKIINLLNEKTSNK